MQQFDFILTKDQRDLYIANWKKLHADKAQITAQSYLLFTFLSPAVPDIETKLLQAFSKRKYGSHAYEGLLLNLRQLCQSANTYKMATLHRVYEDLGGIELTPEQFTRLYTLAKGALDRIRQDYAYA